MLKDWDTYKTDEARWNDLRVGVLHLSEGSIFPQGPAVSFQRSAMLDNACFCDISIYDQTQRISVLYFGIPKDQGKALLESRLELKLESRPDSERIFVPEQILLSPEANGPRTPGTEAI